MCQQKSLAICRIYSNISHRCFQRFCPSAPGCANCGHFMKFWESGLLQVTAYFPGLLERNLHTFYLCSEVAKSQQSSIWKLCIFLARHCTLIRNTFSTQPSDQGWLASIQPLKLLPPIWAIVLISEIWMMPVKIHLRQKKVGAPGQDVHSHVLVGNTFI